MHSCLANPTATRCTLKTLLNTAMYVSIVLLVNILALYNILSILRKLNIFLFEAMRRRKDTNYLIHHKKTYRMDRRFPDVLRMICGKFFLEIRSRETHGASLHPYATNSPAGFVKSTRVYASDLPVKSPSSSGQILSRSRNSHFTHAGQNSFSV